MSEYNVQAVLDGITTNLELNESTGLYEAELTAPSRSSYNNNTSHCFPITVTATKESDGTQATENIEVRVKEINPPIIAIQNPLASITAITNPVVRFTVLDNDSGVDIDTIGISIDNGFAIIRSITKTPIEDGYKCQYSISTTLQDGTHTISVEASDHDGNKTQESVEFIVSTNPPEIIIINPENNTSTNKSKITVSGTVKGLTIPLSKVTIKVNNGAEIQVSVNTDGTFSEEITLLNGVNTITVIAVDLGGAETQELIKVRFDSDAPIITNVVIIPNPVSTRNVMTISADVIDY